MTDNNRYTSEILTLECAHDVMDSKGNLVRYSSLSIDHMRCIQRLGEGYGCNAEHLFYFTYQAEPKAKEIKGELSLEAIESFRDAIDNKDSCLTLWYSPMNRNTRSKKLRLLSIPLSGDYGFRCFIERFVAILLFTASDALKIEVGDYAVIVDTEEVGPNTIFS